MGMRVEGGARGRRQSEITVVVLITEVLKTQLLRIRSFQMLLPEESKLTNWPEGSRLQGTKTRRSVKLNYVCLLVRPQLSNIKSKNRSRDRSHQIVTTGNGKTGIVISEAP